MMLSPTRLTKLLSPFGFSLLHVNKTTKEILLVRNARVPRLYECLMISGQGKRGEAVYAQNSVSAAPLHPYDECVSEADQALIYALETDKERHWTIVETSEQAEAWEESLAAHADKYCRETGSGHGPGLFERLQPVFEAFDRYVDRLGDTNLVFESEYRFQNEATHKQQAEAERLASGHGDWPENAEDIQLACLVLVRFADEVEGVTDPYLGKKVEDEPELRGWIYLLADYLCKQREAYSI